MVANAFMQVEMSGQPNGGSQVPPGLFELTLSVLLGPTCRNISRYGCGGNLASI